MVDDDERNLLALSQVLEDVAEVVTAISGKEALRHLLERDFAVILLDVFMPGMDGYEVASLIRQRKHTSRIPIIFLSAVNKETEHLMRGYAMGAVDYVFKPVDPLILKSKVGVFVDLYEMRLQIEAKSRAEQQLKEANFRAKLEKLKVERELDESRMRQAALLDALPIALYEAEVEADGMFRRSFVGGDLSSIVGDIAADIESGTLTWENGIHGEDRSSLSLPRNGEADTMSFEYRWTARNASTRHFIEQCVRLRGAGENGRWVGTLIDVSERKQLEAQLLQAGKLDAIGQLTGGVAHDFNNLLAAVLGGITLLEKRVEFAPREQTVLQQMRHAAENGAELIRRMMAFARKQDLRPVSTGTGNLCQSVSGLLQHTLGGTFNIDWHCEGATRNFYVDEAQLELALVNLIINARDSMPSGGTIDVHVEDVPIEEATAQGLKPGDYLCVKVTDRGVGIPGDMIDRIVEPFFTTKEVGKGTGLGLSMVAGFVQQSGGRLAIGSQPGLGTTIEMYLPATIDSVIEKEETNSQDVEKISRSILLVDDDDTVREILKEQLQDMNLDVVAVPDGISALEALEDPASHFDVLLTDFAMPGIDGSETIIRARRIRPEIRTLLMTGYADDSMISEKLGMTPILRKPIDPSVLQKALR